MVLGIMRLINTSFLQLLVKGRSCHPRSCHVDSLVMKVSQEGTTPIFAI